MDNENLKKSSIKGFIWRAVQNISTQLIAFIIQIILARILLPSDFGIIALTSTFITIMNVIVTTGFTSAIVQQKVVDETDKSSMFFLSVAIGFLLYIIVYFISPFLAIFYNEDVLTNVFRVQGISLIIASLFSVHNAIIMRNLDFKKSFISGLIAVCVQGVVGIIMAIHGFGIWALVISTIANNAVNCIMLFLLCRWVPKLSFSFKSIKRMFSFSSKILANNLLNAVYNSAKTLIIGKVYDSEMVGYYNKGYQFPTTMMNGIDGAMTTVLFSSLSKIQDDKERFVAYLRRSMKLSLTIIVPLLFGMAAVADPMIRLLLTDKWAEAIPFVEITCFICLFWPLSARSQALNAIGKSGTNLVISIIIKLLGVGLIFASVPFGVYVMCASSIVSALINFIVYSIVLSKFFHYTIKQQILDVVPTYLIGLSMFGVVFGLSYIINLNLILKLSILVLIGAVFYIGISLLFRQEGFMYILKMLKQLFRKGEKND